MTRIAGWLVALLVLGAAHAAFGADAAPCRSVSFERDTFTVCRYVPIEDEIRLAWRGRVGPLGDFTALRSWLGRDAERVAFAMNAGMYDRFRRPVGLYVDAGQMLRPLNRAAGAGNFFLLPNGVFWVDDHGGPHVDETSAFAALAVHPRWATQSGPLLVRAGALHPAIAPNGSSLMIRNGVGVRDGEALFVISDEPVSFGRFARLFRDELGCPDALYLDGAISSLWAPAMGRQDPRTGLGPFVIVLRAPPPRATP